jgi:hypothetical protein
MTAKEKIRDVLLAGDRRTLGRSDEVLEFVAAKPAALRQVMDCLFDADAGVCLRASDVVEKVSQIDAGLVQPFKGLLLGLLAEVTQIEVRWHLALIVPRLRLSRAECRQVAGILRSYLEDRSSIVKTCALQGLSDLARQDGLLKPEVRELLESAAASGTAAMRARARKLLRASYN